MSTNEPWYGVRLLYKHVRTSGQTYEERILIIRAHSAEDAIAEAEAISEREYEDELTERLEYVMTFHIFDVDGPCLESGTEVFSLMRDSDLHPEKYIDRFHSTGSEYCQDVDESPR